MKNKTGYFYKDNWNGKKHSFATLKEAKKAAAQETGIEIAVFNAKTNKIHFTSASGFVYP